jgi:cyclopropane-fatty-acyl-phospholipid synthase
VLGPNRKYSCCYWREGAVDLADAEYEALSRTVERAQLADGQQILELGCGWGSLTLFMAERFPNASIVAVSNSAPQRKYISRQALRRGLKNVKVITCDMNAFAAGRRFDRVVSVEMFEHMRNYSRLFENVRDWLVPDGKFFMHIFVHRAVPYAFEDRDADDWMSRHFFSGGMMPSAGLPLHFQDHLRLERQWTWSGTHYEKTANAWLANLDSCREQVLPILEASYGRDSAEVWLQRWRIFFMACAELWGFRAGQEWLVRPLSVPAAAGVRSWACSGCSTSWPTSLHGSRVYSARHTTWLGPALYSQSRLRPCTWRCAAIRPSCDWSSARPRSASW